MNPKTRLVAASIAALALLTTLGCGGGGGGGGKVDAKAADSSATTGATDASTATTKPNGSVPPGGASGGDPCRLLTSAEAEAVLGRAVDAPVTHDLSDPVYGNGFDCSYSDAGSSSVHTALLGDKVPRDEWEQAERQEDLQEVSGVGELAFFDEHNEEIVAFDHGRAIQVGLTNGTTGSELLALLTEMARNALGRI